MAWPSRDWQTKIGIIQRSAELNAFIHDRSNADFITSTNYSLNGIEEWPAQRR